MKLFRRRGRDIPDQPPADLDVALEDPAPAVSEPEGWTLPEGAYVTDGASLFRVAHALRDPRGGELIVELEDCRTLELILCPARAMVDLDLDTVTPRAIR